ncbi:hypothetical protein [Flavobacterium cerinum]|uniref:Uncharacterized protein n=1 Tax=Flavobacterium cerinum TaxID=2502784 RepID=A0A3S3SF81_9FLAO|nr:hypothetical protein [Flavobacterium cerinum]RWX00880.1 hypothetical protein EPI11_07610 [Flavobacterium cerinum]RWX00987.1 hypothetical protein EPI11_08170 [Flavobacterium cerinum]
MSIIFSIIGFTILGAFIRAIFKDKSIRDKPKDTSEWVVQLIFCLIVGAIVWAFIPKNCGGHKNEDYDPFEHRKLSRD